MRAEEQAETVREARACVVPGKGGAGRWTEEDCLEEREEAM